MPDNDTILSNIDADDLVEINGGFKNFNYIGKNTKNTYLHLLAIFSSNFSLYKDLILRIIDNNLIDVNSLNIKGRSCIHEAFKYSNYEFIKLIIKKTNINLSHKDINNHSPFCWACYRGDISMIIFILENGGSFEEGDLSYISNNSLRNQISKILIYKRIDYKQMINDDEMPEDYEFKIYRESDFIFENRIIAEGSFGSIIIATDKNTGGKRILKKFKNDYTYSFLSDEIRDIIFLKNLKRNKHVVQLYGIFLINDDIYMVMEHLLVNIESVIEYNFYLDDIEERRKKFKKLLLETIKCVDANSQIGLIHCDTKSNNMMINDKGTVKYIDYGFSYYLGISPFVNNINKRIHIGTYLIDDGVKKDNQLTEYYDNKGNLLFKINKNYTSYNIDILSVAYMFISEIIGYSNKHFTHKGILYSREEKSNICTNVNHYERKIEEIFGTEIKNILYSMLEIDSSIRPMAKELINLPFFNERILNIPKNFELTDINFNDTFMNLYDPYNTINMKNYIRIGFIYFDDIKNHWKNKSIETICIKNNNLFKIFGNLKDLTFKYKICTDALFNTIYYIISCINRNERNTESPFSINDIIKNKNISMYILLQYSNLYDDSSFNIDGLFIEVTKDESLTKIQFEKNCQKLANKIKADINFYNMTPTMFYVGYIKFILQYITKNLSRIKLLYKNLTERIYENITTYGKFEDNSITIEKLVIDSYNSLPEKFDLIF